MNGELLRDWKTALEHRKMLLCIRTAEGTKMTAETRTNYLRNRSLSCHRCDSLLAYFINMLPSAYDAASYVQLISCFKVREPANIFYLSSVAPQRNSWKCKLYFVDTFQTEVCWLESNPKSLDGMRTVQAIRTLSCRPTVCSSACGLHYVIDGW